MRILRMMILFLALLPTTGFAVEFGTARISLIKGDVQIFTDDTHEWVAASINMPLREGDRIWVPEGARSEVQIQGGVYIRLDSATSFDILALQEESFQFYMDGGGGYINNRKGGIDHIQIDTPQSSIGCYDNSLVMIDVAQSGATDVSIIKGYASAETREGQSRIEAGDTLHIGADMNAVISPLPPPDEWENWNQQRDKKLANGSRSLRYIPEELDDYASDLDDNGKWVYVTDYGYCWTPLSVSVGWSPYKNGRWTWVGNDYVWVSYEKWGWCPHHYGRWAFVANFGWCWVPPRVGSVYWAPGYVGWVHTSDYVAWVPLAPGEIYYGRGLYGPQSVNITNITINRNVVNFRNVNVSNAITVVNRTTFITGGKEPVRFRGNPFKERDNEQGPPAIKPTRTSAMPVLKSIPPNSRPPERVRRISVNEIKRERQIVKEEKGSAFKNARPGAEMPVRKVNEPQKTIREKQPSFLPKNPSNREQPVIRGDRQPAAGTPEAIKARSMPPVRPVSPPAVRPTQPSAQTAPLPRKPETQAPVGTIHNNPGMQQGRERAKLREPRWQEQIPDRRSNTPRQNVPQIGPVATPGARQQSPVQASPAVKPDAWQQKAPTVAPGGRPDVRQQSPVTASPAAKPDARQLKAPSIVPGGGPGARQQSPVTASPAAKPDARQQRAPSAVPDKQGTPMNQQRGRPDAEPKKIMEHRSAHPESPKPTEGETEKKKPERPNPDMSR